MSLFSLKIIAESLKSEHRLLVEQVLGVYGFSDEFISSELSVFEELLKSEGFSKKDLILIKSIVANSQNISNSILDLYELEKKFISIDEKNTFLKIKCDLALARIAYCYKLRDIILQAKVKRIKYKMARQASVANFFDVFARETLGFNEQISPEDFLMSAVSRYVVIYKEDGVYIKIANPFNRERELRSQYQKELKLLEQDGQPVQGFDQPESSHYATLQALTNGNYVSYPSDRRDIGQIAMPYKIGNKVVSIYFIKGEVLLEQIADPDKLERKNNLIKKIVSRANLYTEKIVRDLIIEEFSVKLRLASELDVFFDNIQDIMDMLFLKKISFSFRAVGDMAILNEKYSSEQGWFIDVLPSKNKDEQEYIYHVEKSNDNIFLANHQTSPVHYYSWQPLELQNKEVNEKIKNLLHVDMESFYPDQFTDQNLIKILNRLFMNLSGLMYELSQQNYLALNNFCEQQQILAQKEIEAIRQQQLVYLDLAKTNIFNRAYLEKRLSLLFSELKKVPQPVSFIMIDIDHFKNVNDTYGHKIGDMVLNSLTEAVADIEEVYGDKKMIELILEANIYEEISRKWQADSRRDSSLVDKKQEMINVIGTGILSENITNLAEVRKLIVQPAYKRIFARWGGEEFMLVLPGIDEAEALQIARKVAGNIKNKEYISQKYKFKITATLGLLTKPAGNRSLTMDKCFQRVDDALYAGKLNGRNQVMVYNKDNEKNIKKAGLARTSSSGTN